jgi:cation diffusion facilitator family transporter
MSSESDKAVYVAIGANVVVAVAKFVAASATGSSSMLAESIHSLIDTSNGGLLLWGRKAGGRKPDETHPFGYGKEQYFWTLIVALFVFTVGGTFSIFEGVVRLRDPEPLEHLFWNYAVLLVAALSDGYSWTVAWRQLRATRRDGTLFEAVRASKDPSTFAVFFEDFAAVLGVAVAFLGVLLSQLLERPQPDAIASIVVGLILSAVALLLAYESKLLLVGESADAEAVKSIRGLVESDAAVAHSGRPLTMHLGPEDVLLNLDVQFQDRLSTEQVIEAVDRLEQSIRKEHPQVKRIFIEAERLRRRDGEPARSSAG